MVSSMTGFGRGRAAQDGREMTVELKSVNHRYLDLSFRMPRHISFAEDTLRTALNDSLSRGHVDVYVNYRNTRSDAKEVRIDTALLGALFVLACDVIGRIVIAPYELPIELIIGILGSLLFIALLLYRLRHGRKAVKLSALFARKEEAAP